MTGEGAAATRSSRHRKKKGWARASRLLKEVLVVLVGATLIALLLRMFVVQVYQIPSSSMENTLEIGSRIVVNRLPNSRADISRGDVVVFEDQEGWLPDQDNRGFFRPGLEFLGLIPKDGQQVVVKRVIGVGGDTVECCDASGQITVNGVPITEPYLKNPDAVTTPFSVVVPEGRLWVMGDNRANSADSAYHYLQGDSAFIAEDAVIGRAVAKVWPFSNMGWLEERGAFGQVQ